MDKHFWHERWQRREIGFHQSDIHWALKLHWPDILRSSGESVLVPLCGKSLDLRWLAARSQDIVGIELSAEAVEEFFEEWGRTPRRHENGRLVYWQSENITMVEGDFFDFRASTAFGSFYDRAALVALPPEMRPSYLEHLRSLVAGAAQGLLVTFEYDADRMAGPPFSVPASELAAFPSLDFQLIERRDVLVEHPGSAERGLDALHECAWRVTCV